MVNSFKKSESSLSFKDHCTTECRERNLLAYLISLKVILDIGGVQTFAGGLNLSL